MLENPVSVLPVSKPSGCGFQVIFKSWNSLDSNFKQPISTPLTLEYPQTPRDKWHQSLHSQVLKKTAEML